MAYQLEGKLLEVCDCNVLCPCWIGENADNGTCDAVVAYQIDKGTVDGTNVSGLALALLVFIPGNIMQGNWRVGVVVDDKASPTAGGAAQRLDGQTRRPCRRPRQVGGRSGHRAASAYHVCRE